MIRLAVQPMETVADVRAALQKAIQLELSTLPPYLYARFTIRRGTNEAAARAITAIVMQEMVHMALAANVLNAIGGQPKLAEASVVPSFPGPLPYAIGGDGGEPFVVHLLPFGEAAMAQAARIEEPEDRLEFPDLRAAGLAPTYQTIGQFYEALDAALGELGPGHWADPPRHQIADHPFLPGEVRPVTGYPEASAAIRRIVSEGEGSPTSPLDFEGEVAHYYRFEEIRRNQVLEKDVRAPGGFGWGGPLGVDWAGVIPAIADPAAHDFSGDPAGKAAQDACDRAYTVLLQDLERAVNGQPARLGNAVRAMFDLRLAAEAALATPLAGLDAAAGPAFRFRPELT